MAQAPQHPKEYETQWARYAAAFVHLYVSEEDDNGGYPLVLADVTTQAAAFADAMLEQQRMRFARVD